MAGFAKGVRNSCSVAGGLQRAASRGRIRLAGLRNKSSEGAEKKRRRKSVAKQKDSADTNVERQTSMQKFLPGFQGHHTLHDHKDGAGAAADVLVRPRPPLHDTRVH